MGGGGVLRCILAQSSIIIIIIRQFLLYEGHGLSLRGDLFCVTCFVSARAADTVCGGGANAPAISHNSIGVELQIEIMNGGRYPC